MKLRILLFAISLFLIQSCGGPVHNPGEPLNVSLNNDEQWQANPETTQGIVNMMATLAKHKSGLDGFGDQKVLLESLDAEFQNIFAKCTMKGEGHTQLHNYLLPLKSIMKKIEKGEGAENAEEISHLEEYLSAYQKYFK